MIKYIIYYIWKGNAVPIINFRFRRTLSEFKDNILPEILEIAITLLNNFQSILESADKTLVDETLESVLRTINACLCFNFLGEKEKVFDGDYVKLKANNIFFFPLQLF